LEASLDSYSITTLYAFKALQRINSYVNLTWFCCCLKLVITNFASIYMIYEYV